VSAFGSGQELAVLIARLLHSVVLSIFLNDVRFTSMFVALFVVEVSFLITELLLSSSISFEERD